MDLIWILVLLLPIASVHGRHYHSQTLPTWNPKVAQPKVTYLHFFLHEVRGTGQDATAVIVAQDNVTNSAISVIDDTLRMGPEPTSKAIGDAKGLSVPPTRTGATIGVLYLDFGFNKGKFNGSSFSVFSRNPVTETEREIAVVGGRGKFRMATGFALLRNVFFNQTHFVVEYNVTLIHY